ncbi:MAG: hypothetical protein GY936_15450 [Ignavibacteriae bacterium]|nr:hypothetical protein [Ignavibacteriota bacterium]
MEDFFQILIFIIFIVSSIISSKNKKKKKKQQQQKQKATVPSSMPSNAKSKQPTKQKTQQELFEELFGIKTKPTPPPVVYEEEAVEDSVYQTWNAEDDFKQTKHNDDYSYKEKDQQRKSLIEESKAAYKSFETHSTLTTIKKPRPKNKLQKIFSNPSNLKEYIVVNEVLKKPKALRR